MRIVSTQGATALQHDGIDYEASKDDGVFDVPHEVGEALVRFPHWLREYEAVDLRNAAAAKAEVDPAGLAARVRELEALIASQQPSGGEAEALARVAELEAENEALKAATKPAAKKTAAKKAAASPEDTSGDGSDSGA